MPVLSNAKHERFAQELAKGKSQADAYATAGYKPSEPNASRLTRNDKVAARVAEILGRGAKRAEVTVESLMAEADEIRLAAFEAAQYAAANGALTLKAKLSGKLVDRQEIGKPGDFERMSEHDLAEWVRTETAALGLGREGIETAGGQARVRGKSSGLH